VRRALAAALLAAACAGAPPRPGSDLHVCRLSRPAQDAPVPSTWAALLLRGLDPSSGRVTSPAVACSGAQVRWDAPAMACLDGAVARTELPERPLAPEDVVVSPVAQGLDLVWIMTSRFASGDALGPVALVERLPGALAVRALGPLRAPPTRTRLRLEKLAGTDVLVAEGERCTGAHAASCTRSARLARLEGDRFLPAPIAGSDGACVSPGLIDLAREDAEALPGGGRLRSTLTASLTFGPDGLRVQELLVVHQLDARQPAAPPRPVRRAEVIWTVAPAAGRLVASGAPMESPGR
jgi:hypothetical protein